VHVLLVYYCGSENPFFISPYIIKVARISRNKIFHQSENLFQSRRWEHATIIRWKRYPRSPLSAEIISWYSSRLNSWFSSRLNSWYRSRLNSWYSSRLNSWFSWQLQANPPAWNGFRWRVCSTDRAGKQRFREVKVTVSWVVTTIFLNSSTLWSPNYIRLVSEAIFNYDIIAARLTCVIVPLLCSWLIYNGHHCVNILKLRQICKKQEINVSQYFFNSFSGTDLFKISLKLIMLRCRPFTIERRNS